jgi:hypothetical protein
MAVSLSNALSSSAGPSTVSFSMEMSSGAAQGAGEVSGSGRVHRHGHHGEGHDRGQDSEQRGLGQSGQGFTTLKLKVTETFSALSSGSSSTQDAVDDTDADTSVDSGDSTSAATASAATGRQIEFKMQISMPGSSDGASLDIGAAMQKFVETLYSALKVLHGAEPSVPSTSPSEVTDAEAVAADSLALSGEGDPAATAEEVVSGTEGEADATTTDTTGTNASAPTSPPLSSVSIKLRLTYNSFDDSMGSLVNQLAQPGVGSSVPAVGAMFKDLTDRFSQLLSSSGQQDQMSLNGFLTALAGSLNAPATAPVDGEAAVPALTDETGEPVAEPVTDPSADPAADASGDAAPATPTLPKVYRNAMAEYEQVLKFGSGGNSSTMTMSFKQPVALEVA